MSALSPQRDRRGAQRIALPKPVPASLGGFEGKIVEFSLIGCRFEHVDRVTLKSRLNLQFVWRKATVKLQATVVRSEMSAVKGKGGYISGLEFCDSPDDAPGVVRDIMGFLNKEEAKKALATTAEPEVARAPEPAPKPEPQLSVPAPFIDDEPEVMSAPYLQCTFAGGKWQKVFVDKPLQPKVEGFTIIAPSTESEADVLCRAYQNAKPEMRRAMRASFEQAIAKQKR